MTIKIKRVYEVPAASDGSRILIDRLWPRGISKAKAKIDAWFKEIAPSNELRRWYAHDPEKWEEFQERYSQELQAKPETVKALADEIRSGPVTFVYSSKETRLNNAVALKAYLQNNNP